MVLCLLLEGIKRITDKVYLSLSIFTAELQTFLHVLEMRWADYRSAPVGHNSALMVAAPSLFQNGV